VLGWIVTILFFGVVIALLIAAEVLPDLLKDWIPDGPDWIAWTVIGLVGASFVGLWGYILLNPKHWRQWRQQRAEKRERRRRLENFELD
jgi:hypothetical protein